VIAVDANVVAYCFVPGDMSAIAERVLRRDPDWHLPAIWRSEFRSMLCKYVRVGALSLDAAQGILARVEPILVPKEHAVVGAIVLDIAAQTSLSAYDCEYVALAEALAVPLVTEDRRLLARYPGAVSMRGFLEAGPSVHAPRSIYRVPFAPPKRKAPRRSRASLRS